MAADVDVVVVGLPILVVPESPLCCYSCGQCCCFRHSTWLLPPLALTLWHFRRSCSISFCPQTDIISSRWIFMARPAQMTTSVESIISSLGRFRWKSHSQWVHTVSHWNLSACPLIAVTFRGNMPIMGFLKDNTNNSISLAGKLNIV